MAHKSVDRCFPDFASCPETIPAEVLLPDTPAYLTTGIVSATAPVRRPPGMHSGPANPRPSQHAPQVPFRMLVTHRHGQQHSSVSRSASMRSLDMLHVSLNGIDTTTGNSRSPETRFPREPMQARNGSPPRRTDSANTRKPDRCTFSQRPGETPIQQFAIRSR